MRLRSYRLRQGETRLLIKADAEDLLDPMRRAVIGARAELLTHIEKCPEFRWSLEPIDKPAGVLPWFISEMYDAACLAKVGPFAAVAGAMAEVAARCAVEAGAHDVIVENGGDISLHGRGPFIIGIYAGDSPLSGKLGLRVNPAGSYTGLCTSSATVGESISFGEADAVAVYSPSSAIIADAAATSICNEVRGKDGLERGIEKAKRIGGIGVLIVRGKEMAAWGNLPEVVSLAAGKADLIANPQVHSRAV